MVRVLVELTPQNRAIKRASLGAIKPSTCLAAGPSVDSPRLPTTTPEFRAPG
jgi:hypothetical protein